MIARVGNYNKKRYASVYKAHRLILRFKLNERWSRDNDPASNLLNDIRHSQAEAGVEFYIDIRSARKINFPKV